MKLGISSFILSFQSYPHIFTLFFFIYILLPHFFLLRLHHIIFPLFLSSCCRSQWLHGLRLRSEAVRLLKMWVRIPRGDMDVCRECCVCCQVEVSATNWSLVQRSPTDSGVSLCDLETSRMRTPWPNAGCRAKNKSRWGRDFPPLQTGPEAHPASCKTGTGSFPGVKCGWGVLLTTHPLPVPRSWKSRAILLPTRWATPGL